MSAAFYGGLADRLPGVDVSAPEVVEALPPLNAPAPEAPAEQQQAAREASTDAFRLAMLIVAVLCAAGAVVNAVGIRDADALAAGRGSDPAPSG